MTPFDPRLPIIAAEARVKTCHVYHCWHAMREMGKGFHIAAFAQFAGLNDAHVQAIMAALGQHETLPQRGGNVSPRAARLPNDWTCPSDWIEWAVNLRQWHPADAEAESEIFANYWQAKAGKDACKLDWRKTWQNWVRNSRRPNGDYRPLPETFSNREHMERTASLYERLGRTNEAAEIRRKLAASANVIPFNPPVQKMAQNGGF